MYTTTVQGRNLPIHALHMPNSSSSSSSNSSNSSINSNSNRLNPKYLLIAKSSILLAAILPLTLTPTTAGLPTNLIVLPINHTHNPNYHLKPAPRTQPTYNLFSQTRDPSTASATAAPSCSRSYNTPRPYHLTRNSPTRTRSTRAPRASRTNPNNPATNSHPRLSNKPNLQPPPRTCSGTPTHWSNPRAPRPNPRAPAACTPARIPLLSLPAPSNSSSNKLVLMPRRHSRSHNSHTLLLLLVTRHRRPRRPARCIRTRTRTRATCASVSLRATGQMC